jgi:hypothetical protein
MTHVSGLRTALEAGPIRSLGSNFLILWSDFQGHVKFASQFVLLAREARTF